MISLSLKASVTIIIMNIIINDLCSLTYMMANMPLFCFAGFYSQLFDYHYYDHTITIIITITDLCSLMPFHNSQHGTCLVWFL